MAGVVKIHSGAPALTKSSGCHSAATHYVSIMLVIRLNKLKRHVITVIVSYKTNGRRNNEHAMGLSIGLMGIGPTKRIRR